MTEHSGISHSAIIVGDKTTPDHIILPIDGATGVVTLENWRKRSS